MSNPITEGSVPRTLVCFALPFMLAAFLQVFYGAADLFVIGLFSDKAAISAIANGTQFMNIVMGFMMGITVGGTVLIGFHVGEKNKEKTALAIGTLSLLFLIVAFFITPILAHFTPQIVQIAQVPAEAVREATNYIFVCALGIPFIIGYNVVSAIFRGLGDSKTPVYFVAIACVLNIITDFILIGAFHLGALGAALATVFSQGVSFFLALLYMRRLRFKLSVHRRHFRLDAHSVSRILRVGTPLALQDSLISVSFMIIIAIINSMGLTASAAVGVSGRVIGFLMIPPGSFAGAVATMTAQNNGAKQPARSLQSLYFGIVFSLIFGVVFWTFCQFHAELLASIFTHDADVIQGAGAYFRSFTLDCILVSFIFNMNSYFSGCGKSMISLFHSLLSTFGVRAPLAYYFSTLPGATLLLIGFAAPAASLLSIAICVTYFLWIRKHEFQTL